ncbi:MAG: outer membrane protein TolC [Fibrobacteres bacterium]|nr:outer membrane protein TolC [Fibrobacterota bacterium]
MGKRLLPICILNFALCALPSLSSAQPNLTLDQALSLALDSNRTYRIAVLEARSARESVSWGRAGILPQVDASASYVKSVNDTRQQRVGGASETKNGAETTSKLAGVNGTWTVFDGLASFAAHDRLASTAALVEERKEEARQNVASLVILAYVDVVRQGTVLAAFDSAVSLSKERVKITEGKYRFGGVSKLELLQSQLDLNKDLSARLGQALTVANVKRNLNRLLARDDSTSFAADDSIRLGPPPPYEGLREAALAQSPEIKQADLAMRVASAGLREYVGHLLPQVGLSLGYNYSLAESQAGIFASNEALGLSYGVNVKMNLFDGLTLPADYRNARRSVARTRLELDEVRDEVGSSLSEAHGAYVASLEVLALETSNLALARENVGIAMERLRLGTIASLELRDAQENFVSAETRLVSAQFESKRAETELLRLAGRLAQP